MSNPQTQAPAPGEKGALEPTPLIYPEEVLREKIGELSGIAMAIGQLKYSIFKDLGTMKTILVKELPSHKAIEYHEKILSEREHVNQLVQSAIDILIESKLHVDKDVEKYRRLYKVDFKCEKGHMVGVVLVKTGNKVRPVAITTDYTFVDYCEGREK